MLAYPTEFESATFGFGGNTNGVQVERRVRRVADSFGSEFEPNKGHREIGENQIAHHKPLGGRYLETRNNAANEKQPSNNEGHSHTSSWCEPYARNAPVNDPIACAKKGNMKFFG